MRTDDWLGRTLDWLDGHDATTLIADIARQARQRCGMAARQVHVATTSFSVSGAYASSAAEDDAQEPERAAAPEPGELAARAIAIPYGYSRDHRADEQQWMLALATTGHGDVPLCTPARGVRQAGLTRPAHGQDRLCGGGRPTLRDGV